MATVDNRILEGFCVGITADRRWDEQAELLRRRGATVMHGPSIRTLPLGSDAPLKEVTEALIARPPTVLIANTGIGIRSWFAAAGSWGLSAELHDALSGSRIYARGPKASGAIHSVGLEIVARARSERLSEVVELVLEAEAPGPGTRIAVQRDGRGAPAELARLQDTSAEVLEIPVYEWKLPDDPKPAVRLAEAVVAGKVHALTFTSGPALRNLLSLAEEHEVEGFLDAMRSGDVVIGCVGPVCAEAATEADITDVVIPASARLGPLIRAVAERLVEQTVAVDMGGDRLVLQGTAAVIGGERVDLSDTEARVLAALVERRGAVVTKTELLESVWGDASGDPHLVEVSVGRLRRRLGASGAAIQAVPRRGYRLDPRPQPQP